MGKGKGKLNDWYSKMRYNSVILEYKNLREGRLYYYKKQVEARVPSQLRVIAQHPRSTRTRLPLSRKGSMSTGDLF